jgi:hypothetical protein
MRTKIKAKAKAYMTELVLSQLGKREGEKEWFCCREGQSERVKDKTMSWKRERKDEGSGGYYWIFLLEN